MHIQYSADDLEAQMAIKDVFDPKWLLNPTKVFPLDASAKRRAGATQETAA
jgi:glycolate oxidase